MKITSKLVKRNSKFLIILISITSAFLIIGWYGITITGSVDAGDYSTEYEYYLIEPVLFTAWDCLDFFGVTPCGAFPNDAHHYNGQVSLLSFLCRDIPENDSIIIDFYNNKVDKRFSSDTIPDNATSICQDIYPFGLM